MDFLEEIKYYYIIFFKSYFNFKGRATGREYWILAFIHASLLSFIQLIHSVTFVPFMIALFVAVFIPTLAAIFRRLHDKNRRGLFLLLALMIPLILGLCICIPAVMMGNYAQTDPYGVGVRAAAAGGEMLSILIAAPFLLVAFVVNIYMIVLFCQEGDKNRNQYGLSPDLIDAVVHELYILKKYTILSLSERAAGQFAMKMASLHDAFLTLRIEKNPILQVAMLERLGSNIQNLEQEIAGEDDSLKASLERIAIIKEKFSRI